MKSLNYKYRYKTILILFLLFQTIIEHKNFYKQEIVIPFLIKSKYDIINKFLKISISLHNDKRNSNLISSSKNYTSNNKFLLCSVCKNENLYSKEFVDYYYYLGFDKIIIFDNNDLNGEQFDNIPKFYITNHILEIIDVRGLKYIQLISYNYCYKKYMYLYDWIAFFDLDEYLFIKGNYSIKSYFSNNNFIKCQSILFNWYIYDDNNLLRYDKRPLIKRFTSLKYITKMTKFIVRGNIKNFMITSMHLPTNINYCNSNGYLVTSKQLSTIINRENNSIAYIRHYRTKTAEEFCYKLLRGDAQFGPLSRYKIIKKINQFFSCNKKTPEKIEIFRKCLNININ